MFSREWRCSWSSAGRRCSNYIWVVNNFIANQGAVYIRQFDGISVYNRLDHHSWPAEYNRDIAMNCVHCLSHVPARLIYTKLAMASSYLLGLILMLWHREKQAYKPTKEPINYRGPGEDQTHDLQNEATLPAARCPARLLMPLKLCQKTQSQWHARGCTGQLTPPPPHPTPPPHPPHPPSGMHRCQFQHHWVLIFICALAIYKFVGLILMLWHLTFLLL